MINHRMKFAACLGILGAAVLANSAVALTTAECEQLTGNMYLAAIERGECAMDDIQTAAGPMEELIPDEGDNRTRDGRNGGRSGGSENDGGSNNGGGRSPAKR
jgi:hypothetical protein